MIDTFKYTFTRFSKENVLLLTLSLLVSVFMLMVIFQGPYQFLYPVLMIVLFAFIITDYFAGFLSMIALTVVFEQFFTLTPLEFGAVSIKVYPLDFIIAFTAISFFLHHVVRKRRKIRFGKLALPLAIFTVFAIVSFALGIQNGGDPSIAFSSIKNYSLYAIVYFLTINVIQTKEDLLKVVKAFMYIGVLLATFIVIGILQGQGIWSEYNPLSTEGTRLVAASHAFYLGIIVLVSLPLYLKNKEFFGKATFPLIGFQLLGIIVSLARHLWISLAIVLVLLFVFSAWQQKKKLAKDFAIYFLVFVAGVFLLIWFQGLFLQSSQTLGFSTYLAEDVLTRFQSIDAIGTDDSSGLWRIFLWQKAYQVFLSSPIIGVGFGQNITFDYLGFPNVTEMRNLHNSFFAIAVQMGVVGLIFFILIQLRMVFDFFKNIGKIHGIYRQLMIGFALAVLYFLINANFGVYFELNLLVIFYWLLAGLFELSWSLGRKDSRSKTSVPQKV